MPFNKHLSREDRNALIRLYRWMESVVASRAPADPAEFALQANWLGPRLGGLEPQGNQRGLHFGRRGGPRHVVTVFRVRPLTEDGETPAEHMYVDLVGYDVAARELGYQVSYLKIQLSVQKGAMPLRRAGYHITRLEMPEGAVGNADTGPGCLRRLMEQAAALRKPAGQVAARKAPVRRARAETRPPAVEAARRPVVIRDAEYWRKKRSAPEAGA